MTFRSSKDNRDKESSGDPELYPWKPQPMVGWYDPRQLLKTGLRIAGTSLLAQDADARALQPLFDPCPGDHVIGEDADEWTVDYIADTGDGFNSTYAVAYWATKDQLAAVGPKGDRQHVRVDGERVPCGNLPTSSPGNLLILGGDEVYPVGSEKEYWSRLEVPYRIASSHLDGKRRVFAIPGNHDWYENIAPFRQIFMRQKPFGAWETSQRRSYFAILLPHRWWILGTDMQLQSDMDPEQAEYFHQLDIREGDNVILCHAEPHWVYEGEEARKGRGAPSVRTRIAEFEAHLGRRLRLVIAGDLHHYRRHVLLGKDRKQPLRHFVTAGGGGAFLHPTHRWRDVDCHGLGPMRADGTRMSVEAVYPSKRRSVWITFRCLLFPVTNRWFMLASGALYGLVSLTFLLAARATALVDPRGCSTLPWTIALDPSILIWLALMLAAFVASTDTSSKWYRWLGGLGHSALHIAASVAIPCMAVRMVGAPFASHLPWFVLTWLSCTLVGAIAGAALMGLYLFVSLAVFGRHRNEAFSAIRHEGYKNFLRMRISAKGLNVVAFGIDAVPTWAVPAHPKVEPQRVEPVRVVAPGSAAHPFVIEAFDVAPCGME